MESADVKITVSREISSDSHIKTSIINTQNVFKVLAESTNTGSSS